MAQAPFEGFRGFKVVAREAGLTIVIVSGEGANDYIMEANGNGAAFFDYDNDGDMDVLVTNGSTLKHYKDGGDPVVALYETAADSFPAVPAFSRALDNAVVWSVVADAARGIGYRIR